MKKIILGLSLAISLFASVESEVENSRFSHKNGVLIDSFSNIEILDDNGVLKRKKLWNDAQLYCKNLVFDGKSDWRLTKKFELIYLYNIKENFKYKLNLISDSWNNHSDGYFIGITNKGNNPYNLNFWDGRENWNPSYYSYFFRCIRNSNFSNSRELEIRIKTNRNIAIKKYLKNATIKYRIIKEQNTIKAYQSFINKYPGAKQIKEAWQNIYKLTYNDVKSQNNISGYEWFISKYPKAPQVKEAIKNIHKLAYDKAKSINTISAYNTFIISYPTASQVKKANDRAYKLEEKKYTDLGMLGFFGKEAKLEKKARKLLIKAKQIERKSKDYSGDAKAGYIIVANRMYQLLQDKFDESDATLRYLESQEFKDFVDTFKRVMNNISYKLSNIERYSSEILSTSKQGFEDAKADREMSRYKSEEHAKWEKRMHLKDKGYN